MACAIELIHEHVGSVRRIKSEHSRREESSVSGIGRADQLPMENRISERPYVFRWQLLALGLCVSAPPRFRPDSAGAGKLLEGSLVRSCTGSPPYGIAGGRPQARRGDLSQLESRHRIAIHEGKQ